jgi:COP9 signalosome complex subunit 5
LSIVIDPIRTISTGKVDIGAFRTFPEKFIKPEDLKINVDMIPEDKLKDFGVHYKRYYPLDISFFKSKLDTEII